MELHLIILHQVNLQQNGYAERINPTLDNWVKVLLSAAKILSYRMKWNY